MSAVTTMETQSAQALMRPLTETELVATLANSLYPGAKPESVMMVLQMCRASGKDPMKKPYHIVPMWVKTGEGRNGGGYRDVIMPGIADYRTDASRTGQHAGTSEPEFGPDVTMNLGGTEITFPEWCRVSVSRRMPSGEIVTFTAKEYWLENYATAGRETQAPNAMWKKRPRGQLAKCAEAQALRKGFPEVGNQPTADEMEGKAIDADYVVVEERETRRLQRPQAKGAEKGGGDGEPDQNGDQQQQAKQPAGAGDYASPGLLNLLGRHAQQKGVSAETVCEKYKVAKIEMLTAADAQSALTWVKALPMPGQGQG